MVLCNFPMHLVLHSIGSQPPSFLPLPCLGGAHRTDTLDINLMAKCLRYQSILRHVQMAKRLQDFMVLAERKLSPRRSQAGSVFGGTRQGSLYGSPVGTPTRNARTGFGTPRSRAGDSMIGSSPKPASKSVQGADMGPPLPVHGASPGMLAAQVRREDQLNIYTSIYIYLFRYSPQ